MARCWVAGATGFLGRHLVRLLLARGDEVVAVSRGGGEVEGVPVGACDVCDEEAVRRSATGCDAAFLCTGRVSWDPNLAGELHDLHVLGTRAQLRALRALGVRRVAYASTSGAIAVSREPDRILDETAPYPMRIVASWPYYRSKIYGEMEALEANAPEDGFEVVLVNPSLLFGPGDLRESSTTVVRQFLEGSLVGTPPGGLAFVDARDAAQGLLDAFDRGRPGERYLLNAANLTFAALFARLERLSGVPAPRLRLPTSRTAALGLNHLYGEAVRALGGEPAVDDASMELATHYWYASSAKAERELGWFARDPGETLRDTVEDLRAREVVRPGTRRSGGLRDLWPARWR